jgi:hypothetical protein
MTRFLFDVEDGEVPLDTVEVELDSLDEARQVAGEIAGTMLFSPRREFWGGSPWCISVRDGTGLTLFRLDVFTSDSPALAGRTRRKS